MPMSSSRAMMRRAVCRALSAAACAGLRQRTAAQDAAQPASAKTSRPVAAVITRYDRGLHADVLVGRILEGWRFDGGPGPALTLAALYLDQPAESDLGRKMTAKHR